MAPCTGKLVRISVIFLALYAFSQLLRAQDTFYHPDNAVYLPHGYFCNQKTTEYISDQVASTSYYSTSHIISPGRALGHKLRTLTTDRVILFYLCPSLLPIPNRVNELAINSNSCNRSIFAPSNAKHEAVVHFTFLRSPIRTKQ